MTKSNVASAAEISNLIKSAKGESLPYRQIFDAVKELLSNTDIFEHCIFKFTPLNYENQRIYSKQYTGKRHKKHFPAEQIFYL